MATAIEYGLIAAGLSVAMVAGISSMSAITSGSSRLDDNFDKKKAAEVCSTRPAGTTNVVIRTWLNREMEFQCSNWPTIFYPTPVRRQ